MSVVQMPGGRGESQACSHRGQRSLARAPGVQWPAEAAHRGHMVVQISAGTAAAGICTRREPA
jgi:hypothetical protein